MSDYKTANLKPETMERLREYAVGDESVDSAVQRLLDSGGSSTTGDKQELLDEIHTELDRLHEQVSTNSVEDRDFDDWFTPDYARTIAEHIRQELESGGGPVELDATEYTKIADELEGRLR